MASRLDLDQVLHHASIPDTAWQLGKRATMRSDTADARTDTDRNGLHAVKERETTTCLAQMSLPREQSLEEVRAQHVYSTCTSSTYYLAPCGLFLEFGNTVRSRNLE